LFAALQPDCVIHAAAQRSPELCEVEPESSHVLNVDAAVHLAELSRNTGTRLVFISSDLVFDGERAPYLETDSAAPICAYGRQKAEAEARILAVCEDTLVCRVPLMFGLPSPHSVSFIQPVITSLRDGKAVRLFTDEFRGPVSTTDAAAGLLSLARRRDIVGVLHLGGRERLSRHAMGQAVAQVYGLDETLLLASRQSSLQSRAARPRDVFMDSSKAFALGYDPLPMSDALRKHMVQRAKR
jgi:dTDP-4-dehydrorhamnose reductase